MEIELYCLVGFCVGMLIMMLVDSAIEDEEGEEI